MIYLYDFYYFIAAGVIALRGESPYYASALSQTMHELGWPLDQMPGQALYPPTALPLFALLASVPFGLSAFFISVINILAYVISYLQSGVNELTQRKRILLLILCALFFPFVKLLYMGQLSGLVLIGVLLSHYALSELRRPLLAGLIISIFALKPQLILPVVFYHTLLLNEVRQRWGYWIGVVFGTVLLLLLSYILFPVAFFSYFDRTWEIAGAATSLFQPCIPSILNHFIKWEGFNYLSVIALLYIGYRSAVKKYKVAFYLAMIPLLSPYAWAHDYIFALPLYIEILKGILHKDQKGEYLAPLWTFSIVQLLINGTLTVINHEWLTIWSALFLLYVYKRNIVESYS